MRGLDPLTEIVVVPGSPARSIKFGDAWRLTKSFVLAVFGLAVSIFCQVIVPSLAVHGGGCAFIAVTAGFVLNAILVWSGKTQVSIVLPSTLGTMERR